MNTMTLSPHSRSDGNIAEQAETESTLIGYVNELTNVVHQCPAPLTESALMNMCGLSRDI